MRNHGVTTHPAGLGAGDHASWLFRGPVELDRAAVQFFAEGLRAGEQLHYLLDETPRLDRLAGLGDPERLVAEGRLRLTPVGEAYGSRARFDPDLLVARLEGSLATALAEGFTGLRVVADATSVVAAGGDAVARWVRWEQLADAHIAVRPFTGMCALDRDRLAPWVVEEVASVHPVVSAGAPLPAFRLFAGRGARELVGSVDSLATSQFRRLLALLPPSEPRVLDLAGTELLGHGALLALAAVAADRPVVLRNARRIVRELWGLLDLPADAVRFETGG